MTFSGLIYMHICFDLILTEWLTHPPEITDDERNLLDNGLPRLRATLAECRAASERDVNTRVHGLRPLPEAFHDAWKASILARLAGDGIPFPKDLYAAS